MQYSVVALAALVASASASGYGYTNATTPVYTTEVVTSYTTYCPGPTTVVHGEKTYTVTEATTLTITDCPCTIVKPVTTSSVVAPPATSVPVYTNATMTTEVGTTAIPTSAPTTTAIDANSGTKAIAFSGASLAGLLGLAAYIL